MAVPRSTFASCSIRYIFNTIHSHSQNDFGEDAERGLSPRRSRNAAALLRLRNSDIRYTPSSRLQSPEKSRLPDAWRHVLLLRHLEDANGR